MTIYYFIIIFQYPERQLSPFQLLI